MKYVTAWTIRPENMSASIRRFLEANPVTPGVKGAPARQGATTTYLLP